VARPWAEAAEARELAAKAGMAEQEERARSADIALQSADSRADSAEARILELDQRNSEMETELEAAEVAAEAANRRNNTASFGAYSPGAAGMDLHSCHA